MHVFEDIAKVFSAREQALILWLLAFALLILLSRPIRKSLYGMLKAFVALRKYIGLLVLYCVVMVLPFALAGFWDKSLLKDTVFWFLGFAMVLFFNINKAKSGAYFKKVVKDALKWTIVVEFVINFYTFSLTTELIILPVLVFLGLLQAEAEMREEHAIVAKFMQNLLPIIGFSLIVYTGYRMFAEYSKLFTTATLKSLLLPLVFSILALPYFYVLALYTNYESFFVRIKFMMNDEGMKKRLRWTILRVANVNLNRLTAIQQNLSKRDLYEHEGYLPLVRSWAQTIETPKE